MQMNEISCPKCGNSAPHLIEGVCKDCFFQSFTLVQIPSLLQVKICPTCGARFTKGKWVDEDNNRMAVIGLIEESISIHQIADDIELNINLENQTPYLYKAVIDIYAKVYSEPINSVVNTEVRIIRESCDRCSRISGGYFESILQIRATDRVPTQSEIDTCMEIAQTTIGRLKIKGDRLAFITDDIKVKEGLDLYIGSINSCRQICKSIIQILGGTYTESPSLFGQKDGKEIIRMTFAMRLPKFLPGDIIAIDDKKIIVKHMEKKISGSNLIDSSRVIVNEDDVTKAKYLNSVKNAVSTVIVAEETHELMLLDPFTFKTISVKKPAGFTFKDEKEIEVIKIDDGLFLLPNECEKYI